MSWFARAMAANPLDPYSPLRYGMCLDWIGRTDEGALYFEKARQLDPNNYYVLAHVGWHHVQREEYAEALAFFEQSIRLEWMRNPIASRYRQIVRRKLAELEKAASKGSNQPANLKSPVPGPSQGPK
jgi:tetratricopeptide (TPR) repeat protein